MHPLNAFRCPNNQWTRDQFDWIVAMACERTVADYNKFGLTLTNEERLITRIVETVLETAMPAGSA